MTEAELKDFVLQERIKAYIYLGVECEMDIIAATYDERHVTDTRDEDYEKKRIERNQRQIEYANKRIDDLQVHHAVTA